MCIRFSRNRLRLLILYICSIYSYIYFVAADMLRNYINCLTMYPERADYSHSPYSFMETNIMFGITMLIKLTEP